MEGGPDGGFGPVPETKIMKKKLDMVDHPMVDWGIYPKYSDTSLWDYKIASWAVDRIGRLEKERTNQPFFLAVGFRRPHVPLLVSQKWFVQYFPTLCVPTTDAGRVGPYFVLPFIIFD